MVEVGRGLDLAQEAVWTQRRGQLRPQDLDRNLTVVLQVLGQIDRGHPAGAEFAFDTVAILQSSCEAA